MAQFWISAEHLLTHTTSCFISNHRDEELAAPQLDMVTVQYLESVLTPGWAAFPPELAPMGGEMQKGQNSLVITSHLWTIDDAGDSTVCALGSAILL